jgi:hypothetical protein
LLSIAREPINVAFADTVFNGNSLAFDIAKIAQALAEGLAPRRIHSDRIVGQITDVRNFSRLLRMAHNCSKGERENDCEDSPPFSIFDFKF